MRERRRKHAFWFREARLRGSTHVAGLGEQAVHDAAKLVQHAQGPVVGLVNVCVLIQDQLPPALVQGAQEAPVQNHLRQLGLHDGLRQPDERCHVRKFHAREGLHQTGQVGLEHALVEALQVPADERVIHDFLLEVGQRSLERGQRPIGVRLHNGAHGVHRDARVLDALLARDEAAGFLDGPGHDLHEDHVLEAARGHGALLQRPMALEGLVKVREGRLVVLVLRRQSAGLDVDVGLRLRGHVDGVGGGTGGGQGCARLGDVVQLVVDPGLEHVDLHQQGLVVELLDLAKQRLGEREGVVEAAAPQHQGCEARLQPDAQEVAALRLGPRDGLVEQLGLQLLSASNLSHAVDQHADQLGGLGLGDAGEELAVLAQQRSNGRRVSLVGLDERQLLHRELLGAHPVRRFVAATKDRLQGSDGSRSVVGGQRSRIHNPLHRLRHGLAFALGSPRRCGRSRGSHVATRA
mmetsp:Transcript_9828/g.38260  ORF Transcript_9828/g.38260 Transcript_9828/m.38260 type:complete len:464 (+) Transcript_9828:72-1463(+)